MTDPTEIHPVRLFAIIALAALLAGCSSMPAEHRSPCACDWRPIGADTTEALA